MEVCDEICLTDSFVLSYDFQSNKIRVNKCVNRIEGEK